ncbi:MAG: hypothetical protein Q7K40_02730 [bacterium]|nr:hypothetical protein [bacterium]
MIDLKTRQKLIRELEKSGNVYLACLKVGVDKSTFYRWKESDKEFKKDATKAIRIGRENNCDVAEHALMINVKEKKMEAIKYVLSHSSPRYKPKTRKVVIEHSNPLKDAQRRFNEEDMRKINKASEDMRNLAEFITMDGSPDDPNEPRHMFCVSCNQSFYVDKNKDGRFTE